MYTSRIAVAVDVLELGSGTNDLRLVTWCAQNAFVFVTKDWRTASEPLIAGHLMTLGVSAMWVRHDRHHNLASADLLYVAARDLRKVIPLIEASGGPLYFECRLGVSAREMQIPRVVLAKRRRAR